VAKVLKYGDVSKVESDFKPAPVGVYYGKVESITQVAAKSSGDQQFEVIFQLTKDANGKKLKQKYGQLWYYAPVDTNASWARRLKELVAAFGLKPKGGNLATIEGKECMLRLREDTDLNGDYRPNIGKLMKAEAPAAEEGEDEDEDDEEGGDLDDLNRSQLKQIIKDEELDITVKKSMSDDDIRELIEEARPEDEDEDEEDDEDDDDDEEDDDEEEDDEEDDDNYDEMSLKALRQELADRELETKGKKAVLIARLRTDDTEEPV